MDMQLRDNIYYPKNKLRNKCHSLFTVKGGRVFLLLVFSTGPNWFITKSGKNQVSRKLTKRRGNIAWNNLIMIVYIYQVLPMCQVYCAKYYIWIISESLLQLYDIDSFYTYNHMRQWMLEVY